MSRTCRALPLTLLLASMALGCGPSEGDACKEPDDCGESLLCCPLDRSPVERGVCASSCTDDALPAGIDASLTN